MVQDFYNRGNEELTQCLRNWDNGTGTDSGVI